MTPDDIQFAIEPDLKLRMLELRMRAADLQLLLSDTAHLVSDRFYYYAHIAESEVEPDELRELREGIAEELSTAAQSVLDICDVLVAFTKIGGPLAIAGAVETMLRGD